MDYYDMQQMIETFDVLITAKEKELNDLNSIITNDVMHEVKKQQLQSEIDELRIQKIYAQNKITDQCINKCITGNCNGRSCRYNFFTE